MQFDFAKWEGAGNDFILTEGRTFKHAEEERQVVAALCNRRTGIGADGIIFLSRVDGVDDRWKFDYVNADGTRSFCGNGSRVVLAHLRAIGAVDSEAVLVACDGDHAVAWNGEPGVQLRPVKAPQNITATQVEGVAEVFVDTGSPHHLIWLSEKADLQALDVEHFGAQIRHHPMHAPGGSNVDFVQPISPDILVMRTFERGVEGETLACGTGATAAALADYVRRGGAMQRTVRMRGGDLKVTFGPPDERGHFLDVWLWGPARECFRGSANWPVLSCLLWGVVAIGLVFGVPFQAQGQTELRHVPLTEQAQLSVLTGSPGDEVYSSWGHTAIRLKDPGQSPVMDLTFNYGTFAFGPGFYTRFVRGHLDYRLSVQEFASFQTEYLNTGRALLEQPLALTPADVQAVADFLAWNALPENRVYRYEFFGDNCSSRVLQVLAEVFGNRWDPACDRDPGQGVSFRSAIGPYIARLGWVKSGIDFILGGTSDRPMGPCESSFLPDGLMAQIQLATLDGRPIAGPASELVPPEGDWFAAPPPPIIPPNLGFGLILLLTILGIVKNATVLRRMFIFPAGILGLLLVMMWVATDHRDTWWNPDMAWASPLLIPLWFPHVYSSSIGRNLRRIILVMGCLIGCASGLLGCAFHGTFWWGMILVTLALQPWELVSFFELYALPERRK
ncbi:MAG: diaminopimelate epimerase [Flavobacteriales bacterium]